MSALMLSCATVSTFAAGNDPPVSAGPSACVDADLQGVWSRPVIDRIVRLNVDAANQASFESDRFVPNSDGVIADFSNVEAYMVSTLDDKPLTFNNPEFCEFTGTYSLGYTKYEKNAATYTRGLGDAQIEVHGVLSADKMKMEVSVRGYTAYADESCIDTAVNCTKDEFFHTGTFLRVK